MVVGVCRITFRAPFCHSLKEKRSLIRCLRDKVKNKLSIRLSEVGKQDSHQDILLGFSICHAEGREVARLIDRVLSFVEKKSDASVVKWEKDILNYGDESFGESDDFSAMNEDVDKEPWVPESWFEGEKT